MALAKSKVRAAKAKSRGSVDEFLRKHLGINLNRARDRQIVAVFCGLILAVAVLAVAPTASVPAAPEESRSAPPPAEPKALQQQQPVETPQGPTRGTPRDVQTDAQPQGTPSLKRTSNNARAAMIYNEAVKLMSVGRFEEALKVFEQSVREYPDFADGYHGIAGVLSEMRHYKDAIPYAQRAVQIDPEHAEALGTLCMAMKHTGKADEALPLCHQAAQHPRATANTLLNIADFVRTKANDLTTALKYMRKAHERAEDKPTKLFTASLVLFYLQSACDWDEWDKVYATVLQLLSTAIRENDISTMKSVHPFHALSLPLPPNAVYAMNHAISLEAARKAHSGIQAIQLVDSVVANETAPYRRPLSPRRGANSGHKLRVGFVSTNSRDHTILMVMNNLVGNTDADIEYFIFFSVIPQSGSGQEAALIDDVMKTGVQFVNIHSRSDREVALLVRAAKIDVLVHVNGLTEGAEENVRILAPRPAPVQGILQGYCATTGAAYVDFMVGDRVSNPPEHQSHFAESLSLFPRVFMTPLLFHRFQPLARHPLPRSRFQEGKTGNFTRADFDIPEGKFVFCNMGSKFKIDREFFRIWMRILAQNPDSVLWMKSFPSEADENLRREALAAGIDPSRLIFSSALHQHAYLAIWRTVCDLFLDTRVYSAHSQTLDLIHVGVPILTLPGDRMVSRVGASLLLTAGYPQLLAQNEEDYVEKASIIAKYNDRVRDVREFRSHMRNIEPMMNTKNWFADYSRMMKLQWELFAAEKRHFHLVL